jgi:hypothetical protein
MRGRRIALKKGAKGQVTFEPELSAACFTVAGLPDRVRSSRKRHVTCGSSAASLEFTQSLGRMFSDRADDSAFHVSLPTTLRGTESSEKTKYEADLSGLGVPVTSRMGFRCHGNFHS